VRRQAAFSAVPSFKNGKFLASKNIAKNNWHILWKTVIFGNICQIWHHLATLSQNPAE